MEKDYLKNEAKALKMAVDNEKKIRDFYLKSAEKMKSEVARKTIIFLADEELKHIDAINAFIMARKQGEKPVIEEGTEDEAVNAVKEFFSHTIKSAIDKAVIDDSEIKAYEAGLLLEQKGYDFYKKAAEKAKQENVKKLFEFLAKEENSHYALLSNALRYFKNPNDYFEEEESWFFEG